MANETSELSGQLIAAVKADDVRHVRQLIERGADPNSAQPGSGYTALMWAGTEAVTNVLVAAGADVDARDARGHTALMWVMSMGRVPAEAALVAQALIDAGADVDAVDDDDRNALDWARFHYERRPSQHPNALRIAGRVIAVLKSRRPARRWADHVTRAP